MLKVVDANETSGELGSAFDGTLVGLSQFRIPYSDPLIGLLVLSRGRMPNLYFSDTVLHLRVWSI